MRLSLPRLRRPAQPAPLHSHDMLFIKTGVVFDYQTDDPGAPDYLRSDDPDFASKVFAGPIKALYRCCCGKEQVK